MKFLPHSLALLPGSTRIGLGKVPVKSAERYNLGTRTDRAQTMDDKIRSMEAKLAGG